MSKVLLTESYLDDIADAIRDKNGGSSTYKPSQMAAAIEALPDPSNLDDKTITANGTYDPSDDDLDGYSEVTVNVPNSYAAGDEGKVVSNGVLVAQSARSSDITENGTYDTTLNNEVTVDVSGGGGGDTYIQNPPIGITTQNNTDLLNIQDGWIGEFLSEKSTFSPIDDQGNTLDVDWSKPFEICVPFKYSQAISHSMVLFGSEGGGFCYTPSIELSSNGSGIWCGFSTNGSSWGYSIMFTSSDGISLQANKKYIVKATWDGTDYTVSVDDGDTKITKSITPTSAHYHTSSYKIVFGGMMKSSGHYARYVKMYLPEMYIISEGTKIWEGHEAAIKGSVLPSEYQCVEWVASDSSDTQYIETGITPSFNVEVIVDYKMIQTKSDNNAVLCGSRQGSDTSKRFFPVSYSNSTINERHVFGSSSNPITYTYAMRHRVEFNNSSHKILIDDYELATLSSSSFSGNTNTIWLYGAHDENDTLTFHVKARIYSFTAIDLSTGNKICELIPCYRKSDNVIGFFDRVNNTFRTNLGNGTLVKGSDVVD